VPHPIAGRQDILVAMDWTDFDHDDQATLVLGLVASHGRTAPLLWLTVWKEELKNRRNDYEDACLRRPSELVPAGCRVIILADRGFGDQKLFAFLGELGFDYVIRFRGNIGVTSADGQTRPAAEWVGKGGRPAMRRDRLLLISAFAITLLTLLGVVGESLGMDRLLKSNTSKTRTHSLLRQGCMLYDLIPNMPEHRLPPLMQKFNHALSNAAVLTPDLQ
jgi:hypothetical protein